MLEILHCTSEIVPFSKTGGLADVSAALPEALSRLGHRVAVVTPLYGSIERERHGIRETGCSFEVKMGSQSYRFGIFEAMLPAGTRVYFVANDGLFARKGLYGTRDGDFPDNGIRFGFFCASVFRVIREMRLRPDILHCHDWQTGLVPAYNSLSRLELFRTVLTIHNLAYQGLFQPSILADLGLPYDLFNPEQLEFYGKVSYLKAGLVFADRITTVSPKYAEEIQTPSMGFGLDGLLRARSGVLTGILNGADYSIWSPATDPYIPESARYDVSNLTGKRLCRKLLLAEFGLQDAEGPLFGAVGRLADQKGFDLVAAILPKIVEAGALVVMLGTGDRPVEEALTTAAAAFSSRVAVRIAYDDRLAHLIEAGSDFFLMPSRFEPCGLNQMYSMAYGTLPVVTAVGGLHDTVIDIDENPSEGTGIKVRDISAEALLDGIYRAIALWKRKNDHMAAVERAMKKRFSWESSARQYETLYRELVGR